MSAERELVTIGFGNYATLVAAQWANGTSNYDAHHHTLYEERRADCVRGGAEDEQRQGGLTRVPRLLLLDAPHASIFTELERGAERQEDEETRVAAAVRAAQQRWSSGNGVCDSCDDEDEDVATTTDEDDDNGIYGRREAEARQARTARHHDPQRSTPHRNGDQRSGGTCEGEDCSNGKGGREGKRVRLFRHRDTVVPWWRYVHTGLDADAVTALRPLQQIDTTGDVPALHSVGYGLARMRPSRCAEMGEFAEALRRQLERCDHIQGLQCFTEADSLFAGAAYNVLEEFWQDVGPKVAVANFAAFLPLPDATQHAGVVAFAERRRDEQVLNRLLATSCLSAHPSAVYIPVELGQWNELFAQRPFINDGGAAEGVAGATSDATATRPAATVPWLQDPIATAQYLAAIADTALYGVRDGAGDAGACMPAGPAYDLAEWGRAVRPARCMRVAALMGALPLHLRDTHGGAKSLDQFLYDTPLLPAVCEGVRPMPGGADDPARREAKWRRGECDAPIVAASVSPLYRSGGFVSLTHAMASAPCTEAGRVLGHSVTLRGAAVLPLAHDAGYTMQEAMWQYGRLMHTATYLPLCTRANYPLSASFPLSLLSLEDKDSDDAAECRRTRERVGSVDVGAHVLTTYNSAPMLQNVAAAAQAVLRTRMHVYQDSYFMEKDDWTERMEDVRQIVDDYHHGSLPPTQGAHRPNSDDDDDDW